MQQQGFTGSHRRQTGWGASSWGAGSLEGNKDSRFLNYCWKEQWSWVEKCNVLLNKTIQYVQVLVFWQKNGIVVQKLLCSPLKPPQFLHSPPASDVSSHWNVRSPCRYWIQVLLSALFCYCWQRLFNPVAHLHNVSKRNQPLPVAGSSTWS